MKKINKFLKHLLILGVASFIVFSCQNTGDVVTPNQLAEGFNDLNGTPIPGQYIVVYKKGVMGTGRISKDYTARQEFMALRTRSLLEEYEISNEAVMHVYGNAVEGFAARLSDDMLTRLNGDSRIEYIEQDKIVALAPPPGKGPGGGGTTPPGQDVPYGITRVNGGVNAVGKIAWIIDSGIDLTHPDLNVDAGRSVSYVRGDANDQNGHGTHVAGTIAAIDNEIGVVGVAAGATVVAVRVLDRRGSGRTSGVIAGVDYVGANAASNDVVNMSLGGGVSTTLDQAVVNASNASGATFSLAAGNESDDANNHSPARANGNNIVTISAMDINDDFAYFSNYGNPPIDYCAPGVSIKSTWKNGGYNTISGTSMAAPHAAGVLLLGAASTDGTVNGDPDGNPDAIIVH